MSSAFTPDAFSYAVADLIGDPFVEGAPFTGGNPFGPYDVSGWPYLLMGVQCDSGIRATALYDVGPFTVARALHDFTTTGGFLVVENLAREVTVQVALGGGHVPSWVIAPCRFGRPQLLQALGALPDTLFHLGATVPINPAQSVSRTAPPYEGQAQTVWNVSGGGPYTIFVQALDYQNVGQTILAWQANVAAASFPLKIDHAALPMPMIIGITNNGAAAGTVTGLEMAVKKP
jgi:hypothetical protein